MYTAIRFEYRKITNGAARDVICEPGQNGDERFYEREVGEVRWHAFQPTDEERIWARRHLWQTNDRDGERSASPDIPLYLDAPDRARVFAHARRLLASLERIGQELQPPYTRHELQEVPDALSSVCVAD